MDMFLQKCNKYAAKINSYNEKKNYEQTHSAGYFSEMA